MRIFYYKIKFGRIKRGRKNDFKLKSTCNLSEWWMLRFTMYIFYSRCNRKHWFKMTLPLSLSLSRTVINFTQWTKVRSNSTILTWVFFWHFFCFHFYQCVLLLLSNITMHVSFWITPVLGNFRSSTWRSIYACRLPKVSIEAVIPLWQSRLIFQLINTIALQLLLDRSKFFFNLSVRRNKEFYWFLTSW